MIDAQNKINKLIYNLFDYHVKKYERIPALEEIRTIVRIGRKNKDKSQEYQIYKKGMYWISQIGYDLVLEEWKHERGHNDYNL